jgi:hypothetical protein
VADVAVAPIGGAISQGKVDATLIDPEDQILTVAARDKLWEIFVEIGRAWDNVPDDSAGLRSSWLEFIEAKTQKQPSYVGEYANAVSVVQELVELYGREKAFAQLFFVTGAGDGPPLTRLAHVKKYVVNEFIRVQITASGFRGFADEEMTKDSIFSPHRPLNYAGFIRGSRYNERPQARLYDPRKPAKKRAK